MDKKTEEFLNDENVADDSLEESNELDSFADQKPKKSKKPLLVVIIILLLVGASLGAAYKWYGQISEYQSKQEESNKQIDQLQKQVAELKGAQSISAKEQKNEKSYLVIKEWGVKFPLDSSVLDAIYSIDGSNAFLSTKKLAALSKYCDPINAPSGANGAGAMVRSLPDNVVFDEKVTKRYPNGKQIGEYYYYFVSPQTPCSNKGDNPEGAAISAFFKLTQDVTVI